MLLLLGAMTLLPLAAQTSSVDDVKKQINIIKKSPDYIYAESTAPTEEAAKAAAETALYDDVNKWAATQKKMQGKANIVINNKESVWNELVMPRGNNMHRVFVYVKKKDIIASDDVTVIANTNLSTVEPVEEEISAAEAPLVIPAAVQTIAACTIFTDAEAALKQLKNEGKVSVYDRYSKLESPEACYLFIYDRTFNAKAVLTPEGNNGQRTNVVTKEKDGIANYPGHGAIGFIVVTE